MEDSHLGSATLTIFYFHEYQDIKIDTPTKILC